MAWLKPALLAAALLWASPAAADPVVRWKAYIGEASVRFGIPETWIRRVIRAESGGRTALHGRPTVSRAGAMGLMQLMPGTWREMRTLLGLGYDPHEPRDNILAGTAYLRAMYDRFGYPGLFAAYNAGPARYSRHLSSGRRLPAETLAYVASVSGAGHAVERVAEAEPAVETDPASVIAVLGSAAGRPPPTGTAASTPDPDPLFVPLSNDLPR